MSEKSASAPSVTLNRFTASLTEATERVRQGDTYWSRESRLGCAESVVGMVGNGTASASSGSLSGGGWDGWTETGTFKTARMRSVLSGWSGKSEGDRGKRDPGIVSDGCFFSFGGGGTGNMVGGRDVGDFERSRSLAESTIHQLNDAIRYARNSRTSVIVEDDIRRWWILALFSGGVC